MLPLSDKELTEKELREQISMLNDLIQRGKATISQAEKLADCCRQLRRDADLLAVIALELVRDLCKILDNDGRLEAYEAVERPARNQLSEKRENISEANWAVFGRAVAEACLKPGAVYYDCRGVCLSKTSYVDWSPEALHLWNAARKVGIPNA